MLAKGFRDEHCQIQEISARLWHEGLVVTALLIQGDTLETILAEAEKLKVDMIVVGTHSKGIIAPFFVGSISQGVLNRATCLVLVIPTMHH